MTPWEAIELLEQKASMEGFRNRWRAFLRDTISRIPHLPVEAAIWNAAADAFEQSKLDAEGLTEVRVAAWGFHDSRRGSYTPVELAAIRGAMYRLWPVIDAEHWCDSAHQFFLYCLAAGLDEDVWGPIFVSHFADLIDSSSGATE